MRTVEFMRKWRKDGLEAAKEAARESGWSDKRTADVIAWANRKAASDYK